MSSFYDFSILPDILEIFKVNNLIIFNVNDKELIKQIKVYNCHVDLINIYDKNHVDENCLDVLSNLNNYDAIFIGGDANWYTVFNELDIIHKNNINFPLVFICNNKFPNKRRDSYFNPNSIPLEYRQNYVNNFPIYYNDKKINITDGYFHACDENTSNNGVLTAIEDFISTNSSIGIMNINFINEITILYHKIQINQKRVNVIIKNIKSKEVNYIDFSDKILENDLLLSHINNYDLYNEEFKFSEVELDNIIKNYENKFNLQNSEINYKNSQIENIKSEVYLKESQIKNFESMLINKDKKIDNLVNQIENINTNFNNKQNVFYEKINTEKKRNNSFTEQLSVKNDEIDLLKNELDHVRNSYTKQLSKLENKEYCISCYKKEISNSKLAIKCLQTNVLIKKILSPLAYLYLIFKSSPKEVYLNIKLYQALKNCNCFDIGFYLGNNSDLINSKWCKFFSLELHYVCAGFKEGRIFNKKFINRKTKKGLLEYLGDNG